MDNDTRTMHDLVKNALGCQDAVNLSGCVYSFAKDIARLRVLLNEELKEQFSTTKLNTHPVSVMYTSKLADLSHCEHGRYYRDAQEWCDNVLKQAPSEKLLPLPISMDAATF